MDLMLLRQFQRQVTLQCKYLLASATQTQAALVNREIEGVFFGIQNLLNASANISKALWGGGGKKTAQRKALRDSIGIDDTSPLREVAMRNNFEHLDERLERWWADCPNHNIADMSIGGQNTIVGLDRKEMFRFFDPQTTDVIFWGEAFNIQALVNEAQRLLPKLLAEAGKPRWDPADLAPPATHNDKAHGGATEE
jgi:hypothetical protein